MQEQSGICAEASLHGLYLFFNALDNEEAQVLATLRALPNLIDSFAEQFSEATFSAFVGISSGFWQHLWPEHSHFPQSYLRDITHPERGLQGKPVDLMVCIRSDREDVNYLAGLRISAMLSGAVELVEQLRGFRFMDGRDLNGFHFSQQHWNGRHRRELAVVQEDHSVLAAGSYVFVIRYRHDLPSWGRLSLQEQSAIMGMDKLDGVALSAQACHPGNHRQYACAECFYEQGMPLGDMRSQGALQVACTANPERMMSLLEQQFTSQDYDRWLDYSQVEFAADFFAPSLSFLRAL